MKHSDIHFHRHYTAWAWPCKIQTKGRVHAVDSATGENDKNFFFFFLIHEKKKMLECLLVDLFIYFCLFSCLFCYSPLTWMSKLYVSAVEEALAHPYLARLHDIADEPICSDPFSFEFELRPLDEAQMKELIYREALSFNPGFEP